MQRAACIRAGLERLRAAPSLAAVPESTITELLRALAALMPDHGSGSRPAPSTLVLIAMGSAVFFAPRLSTGGGLEPHNSAFAAAASTLLDTYLGAGDDEVIDDSAFVHAFAAWFLRVGTHMLTTPRPPAAGKRRPL